MSWELDNVQKWLDADKRRSVQVRSYDGRVNLRAITTDVVSFEQPPVVTETLHVSGGDDSNIVDTLTLLGKALLP